MWLRHLHPGNPRAPTTSPTLRSATEPGRSDAALGSTAFCEEPQVVASFHTCPIPEIAKLGRTLKQWRDAFLAYFDTGRASNGGTESINGLIELHRRIARGFRNRDNYRLRMLLIGGGLTPPPPPEV